MSNDEKKLIYVAEQQKIYQLDPNAAEKLASEVNVTQQPELVLYDEIPRIATDTTNIRVTHLMVGFLLPPASNDSVSEFAENEIQTPKSGIAAGDGNALSWFKGVWVRGLYGDINQGQSSGQVGFHGKTKGGTIGIDGNLTDNTIIGLSYTRMAANKKYKH